MPLLDYATPRTDRRPWGPILIRPSRRSVLLLMLAITAFVWLRFRHEAWRYTGTIPANGGAWFTPDNQLLVYDPVTGLHLHDRTTGRRLRTIVPPGDPRENPERWIISPQNKRVLIIPEAGAPIRIYDFATGRLVASLPNPRVPTEFVFLVDPAFPRFVTGDDNSFRDPPGNWARPPKLWTLTRPDGSPATMPDGTCTFRSVDLPMLGMVRFSPDGKRLLQQHSLRPQDGFALVDTDTGRVIVRRTDAQTVGLATGFLDANTFWMIESRATTNNASPPGHIEFRGARDGRLMRSADIPVSTLTPPMSASLSADANVIQVSDYRAGRLDFYDTATGRLLASHNDRPLINVGLMPDSKRFVARDPASGYPGLFSLSSAHPVATLRLPYPPPLNPSCTPSPDGRTTLFTDRDRSPRWTTHLFHPTGPDCPESPRGLLAFPHTWLLIASFTALAFSLRRDAAPAQGDPLAKALTLAILLATLPRTLQFILEGATGQFLLTPAPLLFLCGIGLATASRFWQAVTIVPLVVELIVLTYCLQQLRIEWILGADAHPLPLLDRSYEVPMLALFVPPAALLACIPVAILILGRRAAARTTSAHF
jgi:hypothetical protein